MKLKEARHIIHAGLAWANWTDEQREAMNLALSYMKDEKELNEELKEEYEYWNKTAAHPPRISGYSPAATGVEQYHFARGFLAAMDKVRRAGV